MLMRPNKAKTAVHGCHCPGDMAVRMRKVLARPWIGVRVCHLLLLLLVSFCLFVFCSLFSQIDRIKTPLSLFINVLLLLQ